jgi:hypothetical protein
LKRFSLLTLLALFACGGQDAPTDPLTGEVRPSFDVVDITPPVAPAPPADLILQCAADVPPPVTLTATDDVDGPITVGPTTQITPGSSINDFVMVRTWTFTDVVGNTSSVSQTITVQDNVAPVAPAAPSDLTVARASDVPPPVSLTATDNCDGDITVSPTAQITPGSGAIDFVMVRTWTFTDVSGNTSSVSQTITVIIPDSDGDGVLDPDDRCPATVPDSVNPDDLKARRYAWYGPSGADFVSGDGPWAPVFSIAATGGCSGEQIIDALGLGAGHLHFGLSLSAMRTWIDRINP